MPEISVGDGPCPYSAMMAASPIYANLRKNRVPYGKMRGAILNQNSFI